MILVQTEEQFDEAIKLLMTAEVIAMDTETFGKRGTPIKHPFQGNRLIGISTHCILPNTQYAMSFYFPFRHEADDRVLNLFTVSENLPVEFLPRFAPVLNRPDVWLVFHHMKFDAQMFRADNLWVVPHIEHTDDTMVKAQLVDEVMSHRLKDLGALAFGDHVRKEEEEIIEIINKQGGYHKTTPVQMAPYACRDAHLTYDLNPLLDYNLKQQGLDGLVRRDMEFQLCLMEMEWEGVELDIELSERLTLKAQRRMREIEDELGFDPQKRNVLAHMLFGTPESGGLGLPWKELTLNTNSEFPDGIPKADEYALVDAKHPITDLVLEYRGLMKADSTWYTGWRKRVGSDGRIHPMYNVSEKKERYGTVTSRLSSYVQQMPRDPTTMVKQTLRPADGFVMVEFDYAQIEYREAACYAKDKDLMDQFREGADTHQILADEIGVDRQSAKQTAYTVLYGGQGKALAYNLEKQVWQNEKKRIHVSEAEGQDIVNRYYSVHPGMKIVSRQAASHARRHGYVTLWNGRRRHFSKERPWEYRKAFNSVLQGGAAQILVESMLRFHRMRETVPFRMRIQVHDSLWIEVPVVEYEDWCELIIKTMEWPGEKFGIPFPVDKKIIRHRELEEAT